MMAGLNCVGCDIAARLLHQLLALASIRQKMEHQLPTNRRACDRCHMQKLSCKRREGSHTCVRCNKANLPCLLSPSKKRTHRTFSADPPRPALSKQASKVSNAAAPANEPLQGKRTSKTYTSRQAYTHLPASIQVLTNENISGADKQEPPPSLVRCGSQNLDPVGNRSSGPCDTLSQEEQPDLDFSLMLESAASCQSVLDFSHFVDVQTSNATSTPSPDISNDAPSMIFSAKSPSASSLAISVGYMADTIALQEKGSWISSPMITEGEPRPISRHNSLSPNSSSRPADWTGEQHWLSGPLADAHQVTTAQQPSGVNMSAWVLSVAEVNTGLHKRAEQIPGVDTNNPPSSQQAKVFAVDQIFLLSQRLIDLLNQVYPRFTNGQSRPSHSSATTPCSLTGGRDISTAMHPPSIPTPAINLDPGSMLLVLSCHLRLLEIYEKIFFHIECWIRDRNSPNPPPAVDIHFPGLNIGAFSLNSSSGLQVTLVIQLVEQLLSRLRDMTLLMDASTAAVAMEVGSKAESGREASANPFTSLSEVGDVALQAVKSRESDTIKNISRVKRLLQKSGIM